ncbi:phage tail tape measure protein [Marinobacterium rhizophilum]|uniref:Phage tail tape measure protein n=1 Tax=Marinobacterium rhizophilum TaxID=420402 RepID=A0ABY5HKL5_9GAMM|nr:phage tail tape measure protein [Marinobacterium rhizophilum]UTW12931.1 phage tail tape measure protein [Marinobacterium rhizophilum]
MSARDLALNLLIKARNLASKPLAGFRDEVQETGEQAEQLGESLDKTVTQTDKFGNQLTEVDKAGGRFIDTSGRMREANGRYVKSAELAHRGTGRFRDDLKDVDRQADKTATGLGKLKKRIGALFVGGVATAGLANLFGGALRSSAAFERQMNKVEAVTAASAEQMRQLTAAAEEAGATTQYTATQAGQGLEILARAGYNAQQSIGLLPTLLAVATAESLGLEEAAGLVSDTLSVMQLEVEKGGMAADVLALGSSLANTKMVDLGNAISYTGSQARARGLDLQQLTAVLDVLGKHALRGERAGTGLRAILAQLEDPASKASKELTKLGIPTGNFIEMIDALAKTGDRGKAAINAFGIEAGPALRALLAEGSEGIREFEAELRNADGAAKKMADTATDDLTGAWTGFGSAWDALRKILTNPLLVPLATEVGQLTAKMRELAADGSLRVFGEGLSFTLTRLSGAIQVIYNTVTFAIKGIGTFVSAVVFEIARTELALAKILNRLGIVADETVKKLEIEVGALGAVVENFARQGQQDLDDMGQGWRRLTGQVELSASESTAAQQTLQQETQNTGAAAKQAGEDAKAGADVAKAAAAELVTAFTDARTEGESTQAALQSLFENLNTASPDSIQVLGLALDQLRESGALTDAQIREGLAKTLSTLSTEQLAEFKQNAKQAFKEGEQGARSMALVVNSVLDASLIKLGVDVEEVRTGINRTGREAVQSFGTVVEQLQAAGIQGKEAAGIIRASFEKAFNQIENKAALDQLKAQLVASLKAGQISAQEYYTALAAIEQKYKELKATAEDSMFSQVKSLKGAEDQARKTARAVGDQAQSTADDTRQTQRNTDAQDKNTESVKRRSSAFTLAGLSVDELAAKSDALGRAAEAALMRIKTAQNGVDVRPFADAWWEADDSMKRLLAQYDKQQAAAQRMVASLQAGGAEAGRLAQQGTRALQGFTLLGEQDLSPLRHALNAARQTADQLTGSLSSTVAGLRDELDQLKGDTAAIDQRRYQSRLAELNTALADARARNNQAAVREAQEAIRLLQQANQLRQRQAQSTPARTGQATNLGGIPTASPQISNNTVTLQFSSRGQNYAINTDDAAAQALLERLADVGAVTR